jgi:biotin carboxylase
MNKGKKIIVLGAGVYQVPLIKIIKELGHKCYVCSIAGNYPGFEFADCIAEIDISNEEAITQYAKEIGCDAILTTGSDAGISSLGSVVDSLNLFGCGSESAKASSNKMLMKEVFLNAHVSSPDFRKISNLSDCYEAIKEIGFPCILKVVDKSGSRGIIRVNSIANLPEAFEQVSKVSNIGYFLIEKYIEGTEFGVQAIIQFGKILAIIPHGDFVLNDLISVPIGHYLPYQNRFSFEEVAGLVEKAVFAIGIDNSIVNLDLIYDEEKLYVLEIGARMGGTCIPEILNHFYQIDCYKIALDLALGNKVNFQLNPRPGFVLGKVMMAAKNGVVQSIEQMECNDPDLIQIQVDIKKGDNINKFTIGPDRIGQIIARGDTFELAESNLLFFLNMVNIIQE